MQIDFAAMTDRGLVRESNQDVARVCPDIGLALVADGMGGHLHGEIASELATNTIVESLVACGITTTSADEARARLLDAVREANAAIKRHPGSRGTRGMGTTLVAAAFSGDHVVVAHVGDSRCYRLREQTMTLLTTDHSEAQALRRDGFGNTPETKGAADQWAHILTRCMNGDEALEIDHRIERCENGDVFLLCSDGLWGCVSESAIAYVLAESRDAAEACDRLVRAAWAGGGSDNIGVAVARVAPETRRRSIPTSEHDDITQTAPERSR
jgi:serine/threonine protein phosphatase PrpC